MLTVLDLFSGIGGFSCGLERTGGFKTVAFCEIDPFCRKVLAKHWPGVPIAYDITDLRYSSATGLLFDGRFEIDARSIDVICGGFPCQDVSVAGRRHGLDGDRSGLWTEFFRLVGSIRPQLVIVENTPGLLSLGMGRVLGDLASIGYDSEWHCIPASSIGAHHHRDRVWIVAYIDGAGLQKRLMLQEIPAQARQHDDGENAPLGGTRFARPEVVRRFHGIPDRAHRIRSLGNAVVPQVVELIGNAILDTTAAPS